MIQEQLTKRELFAAMAMKALIPAGKCEFWNYDKIADESCRIADALIKRLDKKEYAFELGDGVRIREGINSRTCRGIKPGFTEETDKMIGEVGFVVGLASFVDVRFINSPNEGGLNGAGIYRFAEDWLEKVEYDIIWYEL